ncbi:MAG: tetratricopeptide repeat protein [Raineya sp.]|nr:tetratricopeptide repeat protein [Raineya sp.]MDW8296956.1 tetratricopeptide repeat protein [Raineya sp.]
MSLFYDKAELDNMFFEADELIKSNLIGDAINKLQEIIHRDPTYGKAYNHLGWIYETKMRNYPKAEEYYKKSLEYSPEYLPAYINYAICLSTMNKFDELEVHLENALKQPGIATNSIYNEYGIMYEIQGNYDKAIEYYQKAINYSLNHNDIQIYQDSISRCNLKRGR